MTFFMFGYAIVVFLMTPAHGLPVASTAVNLPDVTIPSNQSETTWGYTIPLHQDVRETTLSAVTNGETDGEKTVQTEAFDVSVMSSDIAGIMLRQGRRCVTWLRDTVAETNKTFYSLCSQLPGGDQMDACTILLQKAKILSLPTLHRLMLPVSNTSVHASLLVAYNITNQYTSILQNIATLTPCDDCDETTDCAEVDYTSTLEGDVQFYCLFHNLVGSYSGVLNIMAYMLKRVYGSVPPLPPVSVPHQADSTARAAVSLAVLSVAADQLAQVQSLMEQRVLGQL